MISVPIHDRTGGEVGTYEFDPTDLAPNINKQLLHDVVVMYQANRRQGTFRSKSRGEVAGSTKKMYRQKGTGRARAGSKRTNVRVGGGHAFAKRPRDFSYRLPKKAIKLATRMALLSKFQDGEAVVVDDLGITEVKTKPVAQMLKSLGLGKESVLLTIEAHNPTVWRSGKNIPNLWITPTSGLNAYNLLHQRRLLITKSALDHLRGEGEAANESAEASSAEPVATGGDA